MILRGWPVSPYTEKTLSYCKYANVNVSTKVSTALDLYFTVRRQIGRVVMPTLTLDDGRWLQDSTEIIEHFEQQRDVLTPPSSLMQFLSLALELFGDEWLIVIAMYTRWRIDDNPAFAIGEFGRYGFPWLPESLQQLVARQMAKTLQAHLPRMGLTDEMGQALLTHLDEWLGAMDNHLSQHDYLLGGRPCLGDFACMGPLYAHVWRDPHSRYLLSPYKHVTAWMLRVRDGEEATGTWLTEVPESLESVLQPIWTLMVPWVKCVVDAINQWCDAHPDASRVPRALGWATFEVNGVSSQRKLVTYMQWMVQRPLACLDDSTVSQWVSTHEDARNLLDLDIRYPLYRRDFREWLQP